ncbi:class I SAM-dependent methyltransferase [Salidesulfovibrio onnuriiensis]|uniref:class I SAM-dependent methyltransferase n=1 Tax=Salidesulfovibrio onnuriiensis TaxID=2583823 RepID=UPI0011CC2F7A|nr:class I SAM-dependent methyltransferase [Salidesulfovibrio onnuriiensis]
MGMNPLQELGEKYGPTKRYHDYLKWYWMHFRDIRNDVRSLLEIGVDKGTSLSMWREFFPNAEIHGLDLNPDCKQYESDRIHIHIGDQGSHEVLQKVDDKGGPFDIVIDDGSHFPEHQLMAFRFFIKRMPQNGIFVIEDIGVGRGHDRKWVNDSMKGLVDHINYWDYDIESEGWLDMGRFPEHACWLDKNIAGVAFYRFICFIMKGDNPGANPFLRVRE